MSEWKGAPIMNTTLVVSISREFGSGGHVVARELSKLLDIPYYDKSILSRVAEEYHLDRNELSKYEEKPSNLLITRSVRGFSNSPQDAIAEMQFDMIRKMAGNGESFIIVGRCSEEILTEIPGILLITIFVTGDEKAKIARVVERENLSWEQAKKRIKKVDAERQRYHARYCTKEWGDRSYFDVIVNSSKLGLEGTAEVLEHYVRARMETYEEDANE